MRRPLSSARRSASPTSPRRTPSGLTMSSVDSTAILWIPPPLAGASLTSARLRPRTPERPSGIRDSVQRARHQDDVFLGRRLLRGGERLRHGAERLRRDAGLG